MSRILLHHRDLGSQRLPPQAGDRRSNACHWWQVTPAMGGMYRLPPQACSACHWWQGHRRGGREE